MPSGCCGGDRVSPVQGPCWEPWPRPCARYSLEESTTECCPAQETGLGPLWDRDMELAWARGRQCGFLEDVASGWDPVASWKSDGKDTWGSENRRAEAQGC